MRVERADLEGPRVRVLNLGGRANADVLEVHDASGRVAIVKDYAHRSAWVRSWLAPWLVRREQSLLERVEGAPGVPRSLGRIDALALALERIDAAPLRRRTHAGAIPPSFFAALEALLEALGARGVFYADLRSPTNVLCTGEDAPVLVDLASAVRLRPPPAWRDAFYRRALRKLRMRFEGDRESGIQETSSVRDLHRGGGRIRTLDLGSGSDPVPVVVLPDGPDEIEVLEPLLRSGAALGRRALGIELPGLGGSRPMGAHALRRPGHALGPPAQVGWLDRVLTLLRVPRVDLVGVGWGGLIARGLAVKHPERVRALVTIDTPADTLRGRFLRLWDAGRTESDVEREAALAAEGMHAAGARDRVLARYRGLPARFDARLGIWRLPDAGPCPVPWLAVQTEAGPRDPDERPGGSVHAARADWQGADVDTLLWKELTALAARATV